MAYPAPLERLIAAFERFPGVGRRTAERLAFHVLRDPEAPGLARAIDEVLGETCRCSVCCNVADGDPCALCSDPERDATRVLVVEEPRDVEAVERTGVWSGRYHVLMGALNPADGTEPEHLTVGRLLQRLDGGGSAPSRTPPKGAGDEPIREVVLATDPDSEGEATALLVLEAIERAGLGARVTRLARGLPAGSALEYLHRGVIEDALEGRIELRRPRSS